MAKDRRMIQTALTTVASEIQWCAQHLEDAETVEALDEVSSELDQRISEAQQAKDEIDELKTDLELAEDDEDEEDAA